MPDKIGTFGAKLYKTSIASANEIGNLISIGELDFTRPTTDSTTHADAVRRKLKGVRNVEPLTVRIAYDPQDADHIALLLTDVQAATPHSADQLGCLLLNQMVWEPRKHPSHSPGLSAPSN